METAAKESSVAPAADAGGRFATFLVDGLLFGVDVVNVQEVLRPQAMTRVPLAPEGIRGLINLRGQIVTGLDMRVRLRLARREPEAAPINVVVRADGEPVSLLVDEIGEVIQVPAAVFERRPSNLDPSIRDLIEGVYKLKDRLLLILDLERVVALDTAPATRPSPAPDADKG
jgi:purine-binding chemotaxis protein CheW